ncbi:MAG: carbonic anhydrase [Proteobacteria bacterium]|nr:carbonic anhydrase [Pseudomonadota bacterium]MBU1452128.1 carbonic anhydrase [Pseudomonadota bacterium]MBU2467523.1 carbonic anhydrase [Pseudomonadota bacterium]MBU2517928.1 carbonic anhydrase [Pseudomonadota bacterium]
MSDTAKRHAALDKKPGPEQVLEALTEGNRRFYQDCPRHPRTGMLRRQQAHVSDQSEHAQATILACSDSRVPVERIFDAGIMDLFVVRVAGNVVGRATAASLEYGALHVHTPVMVVLGHSGCGAVTAAWHHRQEGVPSESERIAHLLEHIDPALDRVMASGLQGEQAMQAAVEENVWQAIADLGQLSLPVRQASQEGHLLVIGAIYDLSNGQVRWLDQQKAGSVLQGKG